MIFYYLYRIDINALNLLLSKDDLLVNFQYFIDNYNSNTELGTKLTCLKHLESFDYMSNQLLRDSDNISMYFGLEQRSPFLFPCSINNKVNLKSNLIKYLKKFDINFGRKTGFNAPVLPSIALEGIKCYIKKCNYLNLDLNGVDENLILKLYILYKWIDLNDGEVG